MCRRPAREGSDGLATAQTRLKMLLSSERRRKSWNSTEPDDKSRLTWPFLYPFRRRLLQLQASLGCEPPPAALSRCRAIAATAARRVLAAHAAPMLGLLMPCQMDGRMGGWMDGARVVLQNLRQ